MINVLVLIVVERLINSPELVFSLAPELRSRRSRLTGSVQQGPEYGFSCSHWRQKFLCEQFATEKSTFVCANLKTKISSDFLSLEIISAIVSLPEEGGHTGCSSAVEVREAGFQV